MDNLSEDLDFFVIVTARLSDPLKRLSKAFGDEVGGPPMDPTETLCRVIYEASERHLKSARQPTTTSSKGSK